MKQKKPQRTDPFRKLDRHAIDVVWTEQYNKITVYTELIDRISDNKYIIWNQSEECGSTRMPEQAKTWPSGAWVTQPPLHCGVLKENRPHKIIRKRYMYDDPQLSICEAVRAGRERGSRGVAEPEWIGRRRRRRRWKLEREKRGKRPNKTRSWGNAVFIRSGKTETETTE